MHTQAQPLGWTRKGRPIWPVAGGSDIGTPPPEPPTSPPTSDKTFTQADLDRIVGERLAREKAKVPEDYDALKAKAAKYDEAEAANKTELEKAQQRAAEAETKAAQSDARATRAERDRVVLEAASRPVTVGESELRFVDPTLALRLVADDVDHTDQSAVTTALAQVLTRHPYLAGTGTTTSGAPTPDFKPGPRKPATTSGIDAGKAMFDSRNAKAS